MNPLDLIPKSAMAVLIVVLTFTNLKAHWDRNGLIVDVAVGKTQIAQLEGAIDKANAESATQAATLIARTLKAENDAKKREAVLVADAVATNDALDGLRLSTSKARATYRLSGPTATASYQQYSASLDALDECSRELVSVAKDADSYGSDIKTLIDAWPKSSEQSPQQ